jgi:hypothetical protein
MLTRASVKAEVSSGKLDGSSPTADVPGLLEAVVGVRARVDVNGSVVGNRSLDTEALESKGGSSMAYQT